MMIEKTYNRRQLWKSITAIVMLSVGAICFVFSCVAATIISSKE